MLSAGVLYHIVLSNNYFERRLLKLRCDKSKFFAVAASPRAMFNTVLGEMQECASKPAVTESGCPIKYHTHHVSVYAGTSNHDKRSDDGNEEEEDEESEEEDGFLTTEQLKSRICCNPRSEEYLSWKENIIANAREQLQNAS